MGLTLIMKFLLMNINICSIAKTCLFIKLCKDEMQYLVFLKKSSI
jgi:hypothetical protein